jgi:cell division protein ZapA (FtsZ GTPase activity inhibitor)
LDEFSIKVNIADRFYPLTVTREQEESVRKAAKLINDKLKMMMTEFAVQDKQDLLSMIALETTTELLALTEKHSIEDNSLVLQLGEIRDILKDTF